MLSKCELFPLLFEILNLKKKENHTTFGFLLLFFQNKLMVQCLSKNNISWPGVDLNNGLMGDNPKNNQI